jgi:protein-tyrosine phosphatase
MLVCALGGGAGGALLMMGTYGRPVSRPSSLHENHLRRQPGTGQAAGRLRRSARLRSVDQRELDLEHIVNLRDLGGLPTMDGRRVMPGRIYRSGSLHEMTEGDHRTLEALGIRIVIDLRSSWEQAFLGYTWPGGRHVAAPLASDESVSAIYQRFMSGTLSEAEMDDWWTTTGVFDAAGEYPDSVRAVFRALLEVGPGEAVLFHCAGGKDRTGLVAALILRALGARPEAILADFMQTNEALASPERLEELAARLNRGRGTPVSQQALFAISGVKEEWLGTMFHRIAARFGSVEAYLHDALGLTDDDLAALRERYLEPATE